MADVWVALPADSEQLANMWLNICPVPTLLHGVVCVCVLGIWMSCAFSALTLLVIWYEGHPACKNAEWWRAGMVICLERGADLHTAQLISLTLGCVCVAIHLCKDFS